MSGIFSNWMIVSDVDGTLAPEFSVYPQNNIDAVRHFCAEGGFFTIATGRPLVAAQKVIELFGIRGPVILINGGAIYNTEKQKYTYLANLPASAKQYTERLTQSPHLLEARIMAEDDNVYTIYRRQGYNGDPFLDRYHSLTMSLEDAAKQLWQKVLLVTEGTDAEKFRAFADEQQFPDVDFVASSEFYYEMLPKGINKGSGLCLAAKELGIPIENTIALGDYNNDLALLKIAGFSVAPENAIPEAKALADLVVCHCKDGALAQAVEYLEHHRVRN